ncbi:hypothetical protein MOX02_61890 [Methylobacterium oxalidis]|uniref:Uncharacterized protein n=1 Tax=Methylobacterium oxalidis TaxID=944322 RepID=A0A512JDW8_9HYPH|nr:hypothetical protein MOX02_61890 [Methylobacterium oxalidis]GLS62243.1 hypothetical protein GCM10007888_06240 [Methylobacterium oxalidis]
MSQSDTPDPSGSGKPTDGGGLGSIDDVQGHPGAGSPPGPAIKPPGKEPPQPGSDPTRTVQPRTERGPEADVEKQPS